MTTTIEQPTLRIQAKSYSAAAEWTDTPYYWEVGITPEGVARIVQMATALGPTGFDSGVSYGVAGLDYTPMVSDCTDADGNSIADAEFEDTERILYSETVTIDAVREFEGEERVRVRVMYVAKHVDDHTWFDFSLRRNPGEAWRIEA